MMVPVADNEHPREQEPAAPPPAVREPTDVPAVREPTDITPDQVRQFQEFQRFQELMRQQADEGFPPPATPPTHLQPWGPPPPPPPSLPKRLLKAAVGKLVTGLVVLLVLIAAGYFAIDYFFGENHDQLPASQTGGGKAETNLIYETTPANAVRKIYDDIAQGDWKYACGRFDDHARAEFTEHLSQYGSTCKDIVLTIHEQVAADKMKAEYGDPWVPGSAVPLTGDTVAISSCDIEVVGGPRLGLLTVSKIERSKGGQWIVSAHASEPEDCGGTVSTTPSN